EIRYKSDLTVGDVIEVFVEGKNKFGLISCSHKKARALKAWGVINKALEDNETISCYVKCRTKGGMVVDVFGIEAFLPSSQIDIVRVNNLDEYVGKSLDVKVVNVNDEFKNVVVSHKAVVAENLQKKNSDKTLL